MSREIIPQPLCDANAALPRRVGELLPELFQRYLQRAAAVQPSPSSSGGEQIASPADISIVVVKTAGRAVATANLVDLLPPIAEPIAIQS